MGIVLGKAADCSSDHEADRISRDGEPDPARLNEEADLCRNAAQKHIPEYRLGSSSALPHSLLHQ